MMCCFSCRDQEAAMCMLHNAKQVLNQWNISFFKTRADIEESGSCSSWDFDLGRLFDRTDYMASICEDLFNVLQVCVYTINFTRNTLTNNNQYLSCRL